MRLEAPISLAGGRFKALVEALLTAFPTESSLVQFARIELGG